MNREIDFCFNNLIFMRYILISVIEKRIKSCHEMRDKFRQIKFVLSLYMLQELY